ncbi:hypothetical protein MASR1M12_44570 [Erysipelotrichia bacterium]
MYGGVTGKIRENLPMSILQVSSGTVSGFDKVENLEPDAYGCAGEDDGNAEEKKYGKDCHIGAPHLLDSCAYRKA